MHSRCTLSFFFFQAEDGIRDYKVTGVQTCALPISLVTTAPAPKKACAPISQPHTIVAFAPMVAPRPTRVAWYSPLRFTKARGLLTLVNTTEGPTKTSSSRMTPSYSETLFCTRQLRPSTTVEATKTF